MEFGGKDEDQNSGRQKELQQKWDWAVLGEGGWKPVPTFSPLNSAQELDFQDLGNLCFMPTVSSTWQLRFHTMGANCITTEFSTENEKQPASSLKGLGTIMTISQVHLIVQYIKKGG